MKIIFTCSILQKIFILFFCFIGMLSCSHMQPDSYSQFFIAPKHMVWEVLVSVFESYPIAVMDEQAGYIKTHVLKGKYFWSPPHQKDEDFFGYSSVISAKLHYKKPKARIFITKKVYRQKGFIAVKEEIPSDSLQENVLLYQITREMNIRSQLEKVLPSLE